MRADDLVDNVEAEIQVSPVASPRGAQSAVSSALAVGNWRSTESVVRFVRLPKVDVADSSPVARSRNTLALASRPRARTDEDPGALALGPTPRPAGMGSRTLRPVRKRTRCSTVSRSNRRLRSTRLAASGSSAL